VHRFEVGNVIEKHRIGWTFDAPLEKIAGPLLRAADGEGLRMIARGLRGALNMFVAAEDVAQLCEKLACPKPGSPPG
jgi:succinoglycan biosynthesis protein ExoL